MVYLGDYIGQLLAELTSARLQSDVETVRVAELYASHNLLKHFPVPRIRIGTIDLEIPVTVVRVEEANTEDSERLAVTPLELLKRFQLLLREQLDVHGLQLSPEEMNAMNVRLERSGKAMIRPRAVSMDTNFAADEFSMNVQRFLEELEKHKEKARPLSEQLRTIARVDFISVRPSRSRLVVGVTTSEIKEAPPESVVRITIRVSEEGVEWTNIADVANPDWRLLPE